MMTNKTVVELSGRETQLMVELGEYAEILHWGNKVQGELESARVALHRPVPYGRLDSDVSMTLHPELGRGVFSSPGVEGHREGQDWAPVFVISHVEHSQGSIVIQSEDAIAGLRLTTELMLDMHDVVKTRHTLTNI
ncbi:alpha-galactosidase, partial [Vibrio vulnificus]